MTKANRKTTAKSRATSRPSGLSWIGRQLLALWNIHGTATSSNETDARSGNALDTLERLMLQVPARTAGDALVQLSLITLELAHAADHAEGWTPPDYKTLSEVLGVASHVLADALRAPADVRELMGTYVLNYQPGEVDVTSGLRAVGAALDLNAGEV